MARRCILDFVSDASNTELYVCDDTPLCAYATR